MKKQLIFFFFSLVLAFFLQNCKFAKIDSIVNNSFEVGFTTINAKGRIIDYKDGTPTAHGHCYSLTDEIPEIGLAGTDTTETPYQNVDFESKIDTLFFDKQYFVRPYMRNGDKIVYGEVQKIRTQTPNVVIAELSIGKTDVVFPLIPEPAISIKIATNEPLKVLQLPNSQVSREYGYIFGKEDTLRIDNGFPASSNIFAIRNPSPNDIIDTKKPVLEIALNSPLAPANFFNALDPLAPPVNYFVRAYLKLNRDDGVKYYYSKRLPFRIK